MLSEFVTMINKIYLEKLKPKNNIEIKNSELGSLITFGKYSQILTELGCRTVNDFLFIAFFHLKNILK